MSKRQLIIIPGLSGRTWLYSCIKPLWSLLGFDVHIVCFNWGDKRLLFSDAMESLLNFVDNLNSKEVYVIGASAGGTAAVNALVARPNIIFRVVTVCTPYNVNPSLRNELLIQSIIELTASLKVTDKKLRDRLLPMYGYCDKVVPYNKSNPKNITSKRLLAVGHGLSIFLALTLYGGIIRRFLLFG